MKLADFRLMTTGAYPIRNITVALTLVFASLIFCPGSGLAQQHDAPIPQTAVDAAERADGSEPAELDPKANTENRPAYRLLIHTPITAAESARIRAALTTIQSSDPNATIIIGFKGDDAEASRLGEGSEYEASLAIARLLIGSVGGKIRSFAYVDKPLVGHAVLVALACEKIAVAPTAEIGLASIGELSLDETVLLTYQNIADQRGRFPPAVIVSMIDPQAQLFEVDTVDGRQRYVNQSELDDLARTNSIVRQKRLTIPGQLGSFKGSELREKNFIDYSPVSIEQLQSSAKISLIKDFVTPENIEKAKSILFEFEGPIDPMVGNRCVRAIRESISMHSTNLCFFKFDSLGGSLEECNRLTSFILDLNSEGIETCAIIEGRCKGGAAMVAMACQKCYAIKGSQFGGDGDPVYAQPQLLELRGLWENLASVSGKPEGQFYSVISSSLPLFEYVSNAGGRAVGTPDLINNPNAPIQWQKAANAVEFQSVSLELASKLGWINGTLTADNDVATLYGLNKLPDAIQISEFEEFVSRLAQNDKLHWFLFTIGLITFTTELTAPGGMIFGFISFVCFAGFFWLKMLNGTVDALEIMLFIAGIACICMEVFVLPGFGIFGIGGLVMCLAGAILASQRFVIPVTSVQWYELAWNTLTAAIICLGSVVFLVAMSSRLSNSKVFKRLELGPPVSVSESSANAIEDLTGSTGTTLTRCAPFGMARIHGKSHEVRSDDAYISEGEEIVVAAMQGSTAVIKQVAKT